MKDETLADRYGAGVDPLAGWDGAICPPHELLPDTPPVIRELCKRANEWNAEGDFAGEVLSLLADCRAALSTPKTPEQERT